MERRPGVRRHEHRTCGETIRVHHARSDRRVFRRSTNCQRPDGARVAGTRDPLPLVRQQHGGRRGHERGSAERLLSDRRSNGRQNERLFNSLRRRSRVESRQWSSARGDAPMSESNSISYAELAAAHRSELEAHSVRRDAELQRAAEIRDAAVTGYERVAAEAKARLAAELEDRAVNFAKHAAEVLAPIVANFTKQPDRESTRAIQVAITTLEAEKRHRLPAPLGDIRNELAHAFCQIFVDRDPECLARLAQMNNWAEVVRGSGVSFANELALTVLRRGHADVANQQSALEKLEMAIGRVAAPSGGSVCANPESRWEIIRFGGTPEVIAEKLAEHDRQAFTARAGNSPDEIAARS